MPGPNPSSVARERFLGRGRARLFVREVSEGWPLVIVHGGPDFSHDYLVPELDRLAERFRVVYYDQRGRGRSFSGQGVADDVTLASEIDDLDRVRRSLGAEAVAVLGHSWGGLLAMEYAIRRPGRVSHLVLLNTAPVSHASAGAVRQAVQRRRSPQEAARLAELASSPGYQAGDPDADIELYRVHFAAGLRDPAQLERVLGRLRASFTREGVLVARAIEHRLYEETWDVEGYDLNPALRRLDVPTLVVHGDDDFIPLDVARGIAAAVPGARLEVLDGCGHFSYLEQPDRVIASVAEVVAPGRRPT